MKRKNISKSVRFAIFSRDGYSCRYCGAQSDTATLVIDHVIPVAQGGTNDPENLITACQACNAGKAAKTPTQSAPTEADRLRLAQERNEQLSAAESARAAVAARKAFRQEIVNLWCEIRDVDEVDARTISTMVTYAQEFGVETLANWIEIAHARLGYRARDYKLGMYISGIRRRTLAEQEERAAQAEMLAHETTGDEWTEYAADLEHLRQEEAEHERQMELEQGREAEERQRQAQQVIEEQAVSLRRRIERTGDPEAWEADG